MAIIGNQTNFQLVQIICVYLNITQQIGLCVNCGQISW